MEVRGGGVGQLNGLPDAEEGLSALLPVTVPMRTSSLSSKLSEIDFLGEGLEVLLGGGHGGFIWDTWGCI